MNDARNFPWLTVIARARNVDANEWHEDSAFVKRIGGGANNAVYRLDVDGEAYACKVCVVDERHRAQREYAALDLLQRAKIDLAPQPILLDESCALFQFPIVVYRWLDGSPLKLPLTQTQLCALLDSIQALHSIRSEDYPSAQLLNAFFHNFNFDFYIRELGEFFKDYRDWLVANDSEGQSLANRMNRVLDHCIENVTHTRVNPSRDHIALRLSHVDPNLANTVWQSGQPLRWVDWEFAGWGDPALELADLRWHISLDELTESQHVWLRANYRRPENDSEFDERLHIWDSILVTRWCFLILRLLWSAHNGPDRLRLTQFVVTPDEARRRLIRMSARAEKFYESN